MSDVSVHTIFKKDSCNMVICEVELMKEFGLEPYTSF
jgi:hypothetical protein